MRIDRAEIIDLASFFQTQVAMFLNDHAVAQESPAVSVDWAQHGRDRIDLEFTSPMRMCMVRFEYADDLKWHVFMSALGAEPKFDGVRLVFDTVSELNRQVPYLAQELVKRITTARIALGPDQGPLPDNTYALGIWDLQLVRYTAGGVFVYNLKWPHAGLWRTKIEEIQRRLQPAKMIELVTQAFTTENYIGRPEDVLQHIVDNAEQFV